MSAADFRAAMVALGMTPGQMAAYLRVTPGAVSRWAHGHRAIPGPVVALIEMALAQHGRAE